MSEPGRDHPQVDEAFVAMNSRVNAKLDAGEPLTEEEKAFFARIPADRELPPAEVQRRARERRSAEGQ